MGRHSYEKVQKRVPRGLKCKRQFPRKCGLYALLTGMRQNLDGERHGTNRTFIGICRRVCHSISEESRFFIVAVHILS